MKLMLNEYIDHVIHDLNNDKKFIVDGLDTFDLSAAGAEIAWAVVKLDHALSDAIEKLKTLNKLLYAKGSDAGTKV